MIVSALTVGIIPGDVEDGALDGYPHGLFWIGTCARAAVSLTLYFFKFWGIYFSCIPSASFSWSRVMGSSFGGASSTGVFGAKLLRSSKCGRGDTRGSAMPDVVVDLTSKNPCLSDTGAEQLVSMRDIGVR